MARVTVEDCLERVPNRFALVHLAAMRARDLIKGDTPTVEHAKNKETVLALREVAAEHVRFTKDIKASLLRPIDDLRMDYEARQDQL
jgi:DNA-directed RNA polymerase subunit omega